jgi:translation initiation factor eIF-2B subunit epsilon
LRAHRLSLSLSLSLFSSLSSSKWSRTYGVTVRTIVSNAKNAGDALRFISQQKVIKYNFVLVSADVIANMNLLDVLGEHKARRDRDKNCLVTVVLKQSEARNASRSMQDDVVVAIDAQSKEMLYFDKNFTTDQVEIDVEKLKGHNQVQIRYDLLDCRIDICSPEVSSSSRGKKGRLLTPFISSIH